MDEPGSAKAAVAAPTKRRLWMLSLRGVTKTKVANVFLLLLAATVFSTAILDEISGSEVVERVSPHPPGKGRGKERGEKRRENHRLGGHELDLGKMAQMKNAAFFTRGSSARGLRRGAHTPV